MRTEYSYTEKWCDECRRGGHATEECWSKENSGTQGSAEEDTVLQLRGGEHTSINCPKSRSGEMLCKD